MEKGRSSVALFTACTTYENFPHLLGLMSQSKETANILFLDPAIMSHDCDPAIMSHDCDPVITSHDCDPAIMSHDCGPAIMSHDMAVRKISF